MTVESLIALVLVLVLSALALLLWYWKTVTDDKRKTGSGDSMDGLDLMPAGSDCPLCGEHLPRGDRVHSVVYPGNEFDLMRIHGCRHCWVGHAAPAPDHEIHSRRCPYCGDELPENGYVMAKVYRKPYRRTHVHVYGCTRCKPGRG